MREVTMMTVTTLRTMNTLHFLVVLRETGQGPVHQAPNRLSGALKIARSAGSNSLLYVFYILRFDGQ